MTVDAELLRRDLAGDPQFWILVADALNTGTGLSDPVIDYGARSLLEEIKVKLDALATALSELEIKNDVGSPVPVSGTVSVNSLPAGLSTEATLSAVKAAIDTLNLKDFATEATLGNLRNKVGTASDVGSLTERVHAVAEKLLVGTPAPGDSIAVRVSTVNANVVATKAEIATLRQESTADAEGRVRVKKRFDITPTVIYVGIAPVGTADAAAAWTIQRITFTSGNPTTSEWTAEGTAVWTDRAAEDYS